MAITGGTKSNYNIQHFGALHQSIIVLHGASKCSKFFYATVKQPAGEEGIKNKCISSEGEP